MGTDQESGYTVAETGPLQKPQNMSKRNRNGAKATGAQQKLQKQDRNHRCIAKVTETEQELHTVKWWL